MRLISWLIGFPIAVIAVLFAVSNKATTTFALWPLPLTLDAPLYLATLTALVGGFLAGGVIAWAGQGGNRRRARRLADRVFTLERELREAQARAAMAEKKLAERAAPISGEPKTVAGQALIGAGSSPPTLPSTVSPSQTLH